MSVIPEKYEYQFVCPLPNGFHARPASRFEQLVCNFASRVSVQNLSNGKIANARSILSLVSADIKQGDECVLKVVGDDCNVAYQELVRFVREELPTCDEALPQVDESRQETFVPHVLRVAGVEIVPGKTVVSGFGRGRVVFVKSLACPVELDDSEVVDVQAELQKVDEAIEKQQSDLKVKLGAGGMSTMERDVFKAHLSIANDVELIEKIHSLIEEKGLCAGKAILESFSCFSDILGKAESVLIRERVVDLRDVCSQLLTQIYGSTANDHIVLTEPSVCVADDLTPSQFINLDKSLLSALILTQVGSTSHTVILARSFGIPTLTGICNIDGHLAAGQEVVVDANYGFLLTDINDQVERFYHRRQRHHDLQQEQINAYRDRPAQTYDGKRLEVMANVATAGEVKAAMESGAEGVGLFRTEMLFLSRDHAPSEQEQFHEYKTAAEFAAGRPVIIRTFDIGGDKTVNYMQTAAEDNPVLGCRGVRVYKQYEDLLEDQLRAILRASAFGHVKIMIPMVTCIEEVQYVRSVLQKVQSKLDAASIAYDADISLGIMVEVPSVAFFIPQLAEVIDFLSIGTNDLTQYFLAVDRCNGQVSSLYQSRHPGLLGIIRKIIDDAHQHGLWVGMCGEMAGQVECLPLLLGAGIDEVSVSIPYVNEVKAGCCEYDSTQCRGLLQQAIEAKTPAQVDAILLGCEHHGSDRSVIDVSLVDLEADCVSKQEVIQYVTDRLCLNGRTRNCRGLEDDFWKRESVYSTGLGYGFAVPHCKTPHIRANSICVLRLREPIEWDSIDSKPVKIVIAMTIRDVQDAGTVHMQIFSKLARSIMHEDFRRHLETIKNCDEVVAYLHQKLELGCE